MICDILQRRFILNTSVDSIKFVIQIKWRHWQKLLTRISQKSATRRKSDMAPPLQNGSGWSRGGGLFIEFVEGPLAKIEILSHKIQPKFGWAKCKNSNENCLLISSEMARKIRAPYTDTQIKIDCLTPETVDRKLVSKEIGEEEKCAFGPPIMTNPL